MLANSPSLKEKEVAGSFPITWEVGTGCKNILARANLHLWLKASSVDKAIQKKKKTQPFCSLLRLHLNNQKNETYTAYFATDPKAKGG